MEQQNQWWLRIRTNTQRFRYAPGHLFEPWYGTFSTNSPNKRSVCLRWNSLCLYLSTLARFPYFSWISWKSCAFFYILRMEFPILVRGHFKHTVERFDIETLFIIIKGTWSYIYFYCVEIVHDRAMATRVIALNRDVSSMSHCIEIISHSFSILSSVESASIPCMSSFGCYQ